MVYQKYPRTFHLPFSPGVGHSDRVQHDYNSYIQGKEIVVTEKMDGECTSIYTNGIHARSLDYSHHESRSWLKSFHASIKYLIPDNICICGENVYAKHSIHYTSLLSYFYGFSIWNSDNYCVDWDMTIEWFQRLGITYPPILYRGLFSLNVLVHIATNLDITQHEGFVVRVTDRFHRDDFNKSVVKWVRLDHVTTDEHWMSQPLVRNLLLVN